jgi:DNA-binding transcriptional LysR family regulator
MEHRDWQILQVLYNEKNITKTAQNLFISQPTLTSRLKQLEEEFGVKIAYRGRSGVQFTSEGEYLVKYADEMLERLQKVQAELWNMSGKVVGELQLGVSNVFSRYKLPGILKLFKNQYPEVEFNVVTRNINREIVNLLSNRQFHIALVRGDHHWQDQKYLLAEDKFYIVSKEAIELKCLPDLPRICYQTGPEVKSYVDHWWAVNFTKSPLIGMVVDNTDTCKEMVLNGLGYAILPGLVLNKNEDLYKTVVKDEQGKPILRKMWMLYHKDSLELKAVKTFVSFLEGLDLRDKLREW